jgi:hypothetical protein
LKIERGQDFKEAYQPGELASRKLPAHFFVDGRALLNKNRTVAISFRSELQKQGSPRRCFSFGDESFADQRFNGAMNDGVVQPQ